MIGLLATLTLASTAYAYNFRADASVYMTPTSGEVAVYNGLNQPIVCNGGVEGRTRSGGVAFVRVSNMQLYPGQTAYAYVYTNNYDHFVRVQPQISCRTYLA